MNLAIERITAASRRGCGDSAGGGLSSRTGRTLLLRDLISK